MRRYVLWTIALVVPILSGVVHAKCKAPIVTAPLSQVVSERNPRIEWNAVSGATSYRVQLISRVPDGRILAAHDTVLATPAFLSPRPLADLRAKVKLRINAVCGPEVSMETVSEFSIDTSTSCAMGELSAVATAGRVELAWQSVAGAANYEVRAFSLDGRLLSADGTRATQAQVDLRGHDAVVSVRPACAVGLGDAVYRTIAAD